MNAPITTVKQGGTAQGLALVFVPLLAMMGAILMAPILPAMTQTFASVPYASTLVPLMMTAPAICIALLSPVAGYISDRVGPRRILVMSLLFYGLAGTAPMYLQSIAAIFVSRVCVGIAEAGLMTGCVALLSSYFADDARQKWIAYQNVVLPLTAAALIMAVGVIGNLTWRATFIFYSISLLMLLAVLRYTEDVRVPRAQSGAGRALGTGFVVLLAAIAIPGSVMFYVVPTQLGYLMVQKGFHQPSEIALAAAVGTALGVVGPLLTRRLTAWSVGRLVALGMAGMGVGLLIMALASQYWIIIAGVAIHQMSGGIMFVTGLTYAIGEVSADQRGRATGFWWLFYMASQFLTPVVVTGAANAMGGFLRGLEALAVVSLLTVVWLVAAQSLRSPVVASNR